MKNPEYFSIKIICANRDVLKGNYAPGLLVRGEFKIVETVVVEDEPPPFPTLIPRTTVYKEA